MLSTQPYINKPREVASGVKLLLISAILGLVNSLITRTKVNIDMIPVTTGIFISVFTFTLLLFFIYQMNLGKKWGRTIFLILFIFGATTFPFTLAIITGLSSVIGIITVLLTLLQIIALAMLFSKSANRWYNVNKQVTFGE